MKSNIIFFILSFALLAQGQNYVQEVTRIVGGTNARPGEIFYQVSLSFRGGDGNFHHFCGGSILSQLWIVSAGHCIIMSANQMTVRAGITNLRERGTFHRVGLIVVHPDFNKDTLRHDISMLGLYDPIKFSAMANAIAIIETDNVPGGTPLRATGWGYVDSNQTPTDQLKSLYPTYVRDMQSCKNEMQHVSGFGPYVGYGQYCMNTETAQGICQGDSGGPAVAFVGGQPKLVGLMSFNVPCARGVSDVATNVGAYLRFIKWAIDSNPPGLFW